MVKTKDYSKLNYNENLAMYIINECAVRLQDLKYEVINETYVPCGNSTVPIVTMLCVLQSFDVENWNRRIYGGDLVMGALDNDPMIQHDMKKGKFEKTGWTNSQWCGEISHPMDMDPRVQSIINSERMAIRILHYWREGNLLYAYVRTIPNQHGIGVALSVLDGMPAGFSMRGFGSVDMATRQAKSPLRIVTYDYVARPSHKEAYGYSLNENTGLYLPDVSKGYDIADVINETAIYHQLTPEDLAILEQVTDYVEERSDNVKKIRDMFSSDTIITKGMNDEGTHVNLMVETSSGHNLNIQAPVEKAIAYQYHGMLSKYQDRKGR